ncbi:phage adaptor protein [Brucella pituitosa]
MALSSYDDLVSSIQNWMFDRPDLAPMCGDFIALAEGELNQELRTRQQLTTTALTLDASGTATLPVDYLSFREVVALTNPRRVLELAAPSYRDQEMPYRIAGDPKYFTIDGGIITVLPLTSSQIEISYFAKIPALSTEEPQNWLLDKFPNIYLYAACKQAAIFIGDSDRTNTMGSAYQAALNQFKASEEFAMYSRASARASGPTP